MTEIRKIKTLDEYNTILKEDKVCIKFYADWCAPCRVLTTTIKNLDNEKIKDVVFGELNVEEDFAEPIVTEFSIRGIPVLLFFKNGELIDKLIGNVPSSKILEIIEKMN